MLVKSGGMTRTAARLYQYFRPEKYRLYLSIDSGAMTFKGSVVIDGLKTGAPSKRLTFHQKDLKITSAKITKLSKNGEQEISLARINLHKSFDEVRLHTKELLHGGVYRVEMHFEGKITDAMHGIYPCYFDKRRKKLIATQFESHHAREALPCIDEPEAKAVFELTLETPAGQTVIGNTPVKKQRTNNKKQITEFEPSPKMSAYLLAFAFGELAYQEAKTKSGIQVRCYTTPANRQLLDFALKAAVKSTEFFEDYFDTPYPLPKLDLIGLPDFSSGAMENWGLITFRESIFLCDPKSTSIDTKQWIALVIAHEIAHQWFGNLVTMRWWDDLWLNESFANLMEYIAVNDIFPKWRIFEQFINGEMAAAFRRDSLPNVQSVRTKVRHPDELGTLFDPAIVYAKGGALLHMLRQWIGDEAFRKGLKNYFAKHRYGNTEASDLWSALGAAAKQDLNSFMDNWLNWPGFPLVEIDYQPGSKNFRTSQQRLVSGNTNVKNDTVWQVPLAANDGFSRLLKTKAADFDVKPTDESLIFNDEGRSYYIPKYQDAKHLQTVIQAIPKLSPINRLRLVADYSLMEKALVAKNAENLELVLAYKTEAEESVWSAIASVIGNARSLVIGQQPHEANLNSYITDLVEGLIKKLGWTAKPSDDAQTLKLRNLALSLGAGAEMPTVLLEAKKRFTKFNQPADLAPDIRDVVYYVSARFGSQADFDKLLKLYKELENADERNEIAGALTATKEPPQIKTLLKVMKSDAVRKQDVLGWFAMLLRNHYGRTLSWQWMVDNWVWIEENFGSDKSYDDFPKYAANIFSRPAELKQYQKFFLPKTKELALERAIKLGIEEIEGRVAWRDHNEAETKKWLTDWSKLNNLNFAARSRNFSRH